MSIKGQGQFFDFCKSQSVFHMKAYGSMAMKIYTNEWSHMTKMAAMPIYGKNLFNLLQKAFTIGLETWYVAWAIRFISPRLFK